MDPTECQFDEAGEPRCRVCGGKAVETSRHPSHFEQRNGAQVAIDRVWGHCIDCRYSAWWRAKAPPPVGAS
jgi:hypothetical protein